MKLLEHIKERYENKNRKKVLEEAPETMPEKITEVGMLKKKADAKLVRVPYELERKFLDIVHLIL